MIHLSPAYRGMIQFVRMSGALPAGGVIMRNSDEAAKGIPQQDAADTPSQENGKDKNRFLDTAGKVVGQIYKWAYRLRKLILAIPVIILAISLAINNLNQLPDAVGIDLQPSGVFAETISKGTAVTVPLIVTGGCLVLMFFSRKVIFPWVISLFSLVLPLLILFMNTYPA